MSLELVKERITTINEICEINETTIIEEDIIIPDSKPDITEALFIDIECKVRNVEFLHTTIFMKGCLIYKIIYSSEDSNNNIKSITGEIDFSHSIDNKYKGRELACDIKCFVDHSDYEIINSRKISLKNIISINFNIYEKIDNEFVIDIDSIKNINLLKKSKSLQMYLGEEEKNITVSKILKTADNEIEIKDILYYKMNIINKDEKISRGHIDVSGNVEVLIYYTCNDDDKNIAYIESSIPFINTIEIDGIEDGECKVDYKIMDSNIEIFEDDDGELKNINCEAVIKNKVDVYLSKEYSILVDGYGYYENLILEKTSSKSINAIGEEYKNFKIQKKHIVEIQGILIQKANIIEIKHEIKSIKTIEGTLSLEGVIYAKVLFISRNGGKLLHTDTVDSDFSIALDGKYNIKDITPTLNLEILSKNVEVIGDDEFELDIEFELSIKYKDSEESQFVIAARLEPRPENEEKRVPSIRIYFAKKDDSLWNIGKRYLASMDDIVSLNPNIDFDNLKIGTQIFIRKTKSINGV